MARALDVLTTSEEYKRVCGRYVKMFRPGKVRHLAYRCWGDIDWAAIARSRIPPLLVVSHVADVPSRKTTPQPGLGSRGRYLLFTDRMPPEALPARVSRLNIRDPRRLHIAKIDDRRKAEGVISRTIRGLADSQQNRIVDAWWEDKEFVALSPEFRRLAVPSEKLSRFIGDDPTQLDDYEVDTDGSFVYWPHADVHLGWMQLLRMVDPLEAMVAAAKHEAFNRRYGAAIRAVRTERGLRQADIPGLTARQVGRIEKGECRATHSALTKLASAHGMEISDYLDRVAARLR